jgi:periplasmic copper chaperone A
LKPRVALVAAALVLVAGSAAAHDYAVGALRIEHPVAPPTPPGARTGAAYFTLVNGGRDSDRLLRATSPAAAAVELHSMSMDGNVMRMRALAALDVPAGTTVALGSGGYHLMLVGLKQPLVAGERIPLTLTFEKAGPVEVSAWVEMPKAGAADAHKH